MILNRFNQKGVLKRFPFQLCMPHYHTFSEAESTLQGENQKQ